MPHILKFSVFYSAAGFETGGEWRNDFLFRTNYFPQSDEVKAACKNIHEAMFAIHLDYVKIERIHVTILDKQSANADAPEFYTYPCDGPIEVSAKETLTPAPQWFAMQFNKTVPIGRGGKMWFFHCLNFEELGVGHDGRWVLIDDARWLRVFSLYFTRSPFVSEDFQLVTMKSSGIFGIGQVDVESELQISHVLEARARNRRRMLQINRHEEWNKKAGELAETLAEWRDYLINDPGLGTDFQPGDLSVKTVEKLDAFYFFMDEITQFYYASDSDNPEPTKQPFSRFGITFDQLIPMMRLLMKRYIPEPVGGGTQGGDSEGDQKKLQEIKPYPYVLDQKYHTNQQRLDILGRFEPYAKGATYFANFDWKTPYQLSGEVDTDV